VLVRAVEIMLQRGVAFSEQPLTTHRILKPLQRAFEPIVLECRGSIDGLTMHTCRRFSESPLIQMQMRLVESALVLRQYVLGLVFCDHLIGPAWRAADGPPMLESGPLN
jgi:hypothetical protein